MTLLALAIAPGIAICLFIYFKDKYNKEPIIWLIISFILGMLAIVPSIIAEATLTTQVEKYFGNGIRGLAILSFFVIALSEELSKFVMLRYGAFNRKFFDDPFDGIVYSVVISMGFATLENIGYVLENGFATGLLRMFLSVPAHATFGVLMGYYVGLARFNPDKKKYYLILGLFWAVVFHGSFDFFLLTGKTWMHFGGALVSFMVAVKLSRRAIRKKQAYSKSHFEKLAGLKKRNDSLFNNN
ncbi:MAG: PrsW family glutamic-type intramembrane protease [Ferruginibacter sp.]